VATAQAERPIEKAGTVSLLIFDLDGTLVDSKADIAQALNATLSMMSLAPLPLEVVGNLVGNGAPVLVKQALGPNFGEADVARALEFFLTYYHEHLLDHTCAYPGVKEGLERMRSVPMAVLTNKPIRSTTAIIQGLGLSEFFFRMYGGDSFAAKKPDPAGILALLQESGVPREQAVMVGDSYVDVRTARNAAVRACGVSWGFQPESFEQDPPDMLISHMDELADYISSQAS
jgi:phosphoglycolate phosphatase